MMTRKVPLQAVRVLLAKLLPSHRKVFANIYWALMGYAVRILAELFVGVLVARYLGPQQYGLMAYVISFVSIFSVLAGFGLDNIEVRELSRNSVPKEVLIGTAFRLKLLFGTAAILLVAGLAVLLEVENFSRKLIVLYAISIVLNSFGVIRNYFTSIVQNEYVVKAEIARIIVGVGVKIVLLLLRAPLSWFVFAVTLDFALVASGYIYAYVVKVGQIRDWKYDGEVAKYLINQSFPLLLSGAAVVVYQRIDQVMLHTMLDDTSVGYFSTAAKFADLILFFPLVLSQTITPLLVRARKRSSQSYDLKKQQFVDLIVWTAVPLSMVFSVCSYWLVYFTFGTKYMASVPLLQVMAFKSVGMALSSASGQLIIIEDLQKWAILRNAFGCVTCVALNMLMIPRFGALGSAWACVITVAFTGCLAHVFIPAYYSILKVELNAIFLGWRRLISLGRSFV